MILFYPFRIFKYIWTYKPKTCFWSHKWGKWKQDTETWTKRQKVEPYREYNYTKAIQYRFCERCNKYQREEII